MNVIFRLKENQPGKPTPINLFTYFNKIQFKYSTGEKIDPSFWFAKEQRPYIQKDEKTEKIKLQPETIKDNERILFKLNEYEAATKKYFEYLTFQRTQPTPEILKELFDNDFSLKHPKRKKR